MTRPTPAFRRLAVAVAAAALVAVGAQSDPAAASTQAARPALVRHSSAQLLQATGTLDRLARIPGTAWAVDPATSQVVVSADSTVTGAKLGQLTAVMKSLGDTVRLERMQGTLSKLIRGGDAIYGGQYRCSLGFNVTNGLGNYYFLTAGHCGKVAGTWYKDSGHNTLIGPTKGFSFPGNDYALVQYTNTGIARPGSIDLYGGSQDITTAGNAVVGQSVKRSGSTTHVHSGTVQALNATVNYQEGTVRGLIKTNVCAEGGDSGGPLFAGSTALGLTSGGSGSCGLLGGTTYFQPVTEALNVYGVHVY